MTEAQLGKESHPTLRDVSRGQTETVFSFHICSGTLGKLSMQHWPSILSKSVPRGCGMSLVEGIYLHMQVWHRVRGQRFHVVSGRYDLRLCPTRYEPWLMFSTSASKRATRTRTSTSPSQLSADHLTKDQRAFSSYLENDNSRLAWQNERDKKDHS